MSPSSYLRPSAGPDTDVQHELGKGSPTTPTDTNEDVMLEGLGYVNPYRRVMNTLGTICIVISVTSPLSAIYITAFYQIVYGGYWGLTWGWLIPSVIFFPQALSVAMLVSSMPVNGAFYWWTAAMAPKWCSRFVSFVAGWCVLLTLATSIASFAFAVTSAFVQAVIFLAPSWYPDRPQLMGLAFSVVILWTALSSFRLERVSWIYLGSSIIIVLHLVVFVIAFPTSHAVQHKPFASAREVLGSYINYSEWPSAVAVPFTWFTAAWVNSAWSAPAFVVEATHNARRSAPRAILTAYIATAICGLIICLIVAFCVTDMEAMVMDPTGFPILTLILEHWGVPATAAFALIVVIPTMVGGSAVLLAYSFQIAAFARDGGVPFSRTFSKVNERVNMPVHAILALCVAGLLLLLFSLSTIASRIIYSLAVMAYLITNSLPNLLVVCSGDRWIPGPFNCGRFDKAVFAWAFATQAYLAVMQAFPAGPTWDVLTFNYNWVVALGVLMFAGISYPVIGKNYKGIDINAVRALQQRRTSFQGVSVSPVATHDHAPGPPPAVSGYPPSKSSRDDDEDVKKLQASRQKM